jgi:hypothetical protein
MSHEVDECYTVHRNERRRARKEHRCSACRETIRAGDVYHSIFTVFDGDSRTFKRCLRCEALHAHLVLKGTEATGRDRTYPQEDLSCGIPYEDEWGPIPDDIARLAFVTADEMQGAAPAEAR